MAFATLSRVRRPLGRQLLPLGRQLLPLGRPLSLSHPQLTLRRHLSLSLPSGEHRQMLPRFVVADDAPPLDSEALADVDRLVAEWHELVAQQKRSSAGNVRRQLQELGVTPLPRYTLTDGASNSELDVAAVTELLQGPPTLKAVDQLARLGVRLGRARTHAP